MIQKFINRKNCLKVGIFAFVLSMVATLAFGASTFAWGPARTTFTIKNPATIVTFNSIIDNPNYGDERNFVLIKKTTESASGWRDLAVVPTSGDYDIRAYVHNNAASNLNLVSNNTKIAFDVPNANSNYMKIQGQLSSNNALPNMVWDQVILRGSSDLSVSFIPGSARYINDYNNDGTPDEFPLPDSIVTSAGASIGMNSMNGNIPGCFEYSGVVYFKVHIDVQTPSPDPGFSITKLVSETGASGSWRSNITANPGDTIYYQIEYKNTGSTQQDNVLINDTLPNEMAYVDGSTMLYNNAFPSGALQADTIAGVGINIGNYAPGSNAYVEYSAKITSSALQCGANYLFNDAMASTTNGAKSDMAEVVVDKNCDQPCDADGSTATTDDDCAKPCPTNPELLADDPKCVGAPDTGSFTRNILPIIIIGLGVAFICIAMTAKRKRQSGK